MTSRGHVFKGFHDFCGAYHGKWLPCQVWSQEAFWRYNGIVFCILSSGLARPHDQKDMWLYGWESLMISN